MKTDSVIKLEYRGEIFLMVFVNVKEALAQFTLLFGRGEALPINDTNDMDEEEIV